MTRKNALSFKGSTILIAGIDLKQKIKTQV